jgi:cell division protease FtsH
MVTSYGMTEGFGLLNLNKLKVSQDKVLEKEIEISKELETETAKLLKDNYELLEKIANELLEKEVLYEADLNAIIKAHAFMQEVNA